MISYFFIVGNEEVFDKYYEVKKDCGKIYYSICIILDIPFLIMFIILDYKLIFVLTLINIVFLVLKGSELILLVGIFSSLLISTYLWFSPPRLRFVK